MRDYPVLDSVLPSALYMDLLQDFDVLTISIVKSLIFPLSFLQMIINAIGVIVTT